MIPTLTSAPHLLLLAAVLGYLLGSVPFGMVIARAMGLGNLRNIGSGNIGATNVLRTGNKWAALLTLIFDASKGAAAVALAAHWVGPDAAQIAGLSAFLGHLFPVWLGFRGGKGVATFLGLLLALDFRAGLAACATWLLVAVLARFSSLAALLAAASAALWLWLSGNAEATGLALVVAILVFIRHKDNIARLWAGTETKIGGRGK